MFSTNLKRLRKENHLSQDELAKELNDKYDTRVSKSMISRWERGSTDPQMKYVRMIADYFDLSTDLVDNNTQNKQTSSLINLTNVYTQLNEQRQHKVVSYASNQLREQESSSVKENTHVVYLSGYVSAGFGEYMIDDGSKTEPIEVTGSVPNYDIAVKVNGDSMEPTFANGQILYVKKITDPSFLRNGQFVIARIGDDAYVKKFRKQDEEIKLVSLNPLYKDIIIQPEDDFEVIGTVII